MRIKKKEKAYVQDIHLSSCSVFVVDGLWQGDRCECGIYGRQFDRLEKRLFYKILETFNKWTETTDPSDMEMQLVEFTVYDMDKDVIPKLLVQDYRKTTVYAYVKGNGIYPDQDAVKIGELNSVYCTSSKNSA